MATDTTAALGADFYYNPYDLSIRATGTVSPMPANETEMGINTIQEM